MTRCMVLLTPDRDEGGYSVPVPALTGLFTQGDTYDEGAFSGRNAITFHLTYLRDEG